VQPAPLRKSPHLAALSRCATHIPQRKRKPLAPVNVDEAPESCLRTSARAKVSHRKTHAQARTQTRRHTRTHAQARTGTDTHRHRHAQARTHELTRTDRQTDRQTDTHTHTGTDTDAHRQSLPLDALTLEQKPRVVAESVQRETAGRATRSRAAPDTVVRRSAQQQSPMHAHTCMFIVSCSLRSDQLCPFLSSPSSHAASHQPDVTPAVGRSRAPLATPMPSVIRAPRRGERSVCVCVCVCV
jgi:hypothetical protein